MADHGMPPPRNIPKTRQELNISQKLIVSTGIVEIKDIQSFVVDGHNLWVFINGKKEMCGVDYDEMSSTSIKFRQLIPSGATIELLIIE